jgi:hypothetical protein
MINNVVKAHAAIKLGNEDLPLALWSEVNSVWVQGWIEAGEHYEKPLSYFLRLSSKFGALLVSGKISPPAAFPLGIDPNELVVELRHGELIEQAIALNILVVWNWNPGSMRYELRYGDGRVVEFTEVSRMVSRLEALVEGAKLAIAPFQSRHSGREQAQIKVDLVFDCWLTPEGQKLNWSESGLEQDLVMSVFHSGSTFPGTITLQTGEDQFFLKAIALGYTPTFGAMLPSR